MNALRSNTQFRRVYFAIIGFLLLLGFLVPSAGAFGIKGETIPARAVLTHGPIAGGVTDTSAVIFTRTSGLSFVRILYSTDPELATDLNYSRRVFALLKNDYTVHIVLDGLQPNTTYYYNVIVGGAAQNHAITPRFTTAPPPDSLTNFSFSVFSDLSSRPRIDAPAYQSAQGDSPVFVLQIGDFDHRDPGSPNRPVISIDNWRRMHRSVLQDNASGQDFSTFITPFFPIYHIWDDHDYGANNSDRTAPWKALATQAFKEYYPLPPLPNPDGGLWYQFRYAQAEFFVLDLRSQRDPNDLPPSSTKSMLNGGGISGGQKDWLKTGLLESQARWKFIVSSSVWNPNSKQNDSWFLFPNEQEELVQFIQDQSISGVIILSGDLHSGGAIDDGTNSFFPEISVPTTNITSQRDCTGGYCGTWSEGVVTGIDPSGYALITVIHDEILGTDRVILQAKGADGVTRLEYVVELD
ncbi:MAG: hypothetical protein GTO18_13095 [Anaerolineales bacterium]|nr:hypothetical protein [Anaerolineales bacterium]